MPKIIPAEQIARAILVVRGQRVLLDTELAALYGVVAKIFLQAVRRNRRRFPQDFIMQLTATEWSALRTQIVTLKPGRLPPAFSSVGH